jgi:hypothetical protein
VVLGGGFGAGNPPPNHPRNSRNCVTPIMILIVILGVMVWIDKITSGFVYSILLFSVFLIVMIMARYWNKNG